MPVNEMEINDAGSFRVSVEKVPPVTTTALELKAMLIVYDRLISFLSDRAAMKAWIS